jgi:hypothetical protein
MALAADVRSLVAGGSPIAQAQPLVARGAILVAAPGGAPPGLAPYLAADSACRLAAVALPSDARYVGYRYEAWDSGGMAADCLAGQDCPVGNARWPQHVGVDRAAEGTLVWGLLEGRPGGGARAGRLTVYFRPGAGAR